MFLTSATFLLLLLEEHRELGDVLRQDVKERLVEAGFAGELLQAPLLHDEAAEEGVFGTD